jgi:hypothetical protein
MNPAKFPCMHSKTPTIKTEEITTGLSWNSSSKNTLSEAFKSPLKTTPKLSQIMTPNPTTFSTSSVICIQSVPNAPSPKTPLSSICLPPKTPISPLHTYLEMKAFKNYKTAAFNRTIILNFKTVD